jgi:hypothetical protein
MTACAETVETLSTHKTKTRLRPETRQDETKTETKQNLRLRLPNFVRALRTVFSLNLETSCRRKRRKRALEEEEHFTKGSA